MKKFLFVVGLLAMIMVLPSMVMAATVKINWGTYYGLNSGGEFLLTSKDVNPGPDYFNPFNSFCLEVNEHIYIGGVYNWTQSNSAIKGGTGSSDPISKGTAFLFRAYALGGLGSAYGSNADAAILQETFWFLEGEAGYPSNSKYLDLLYGSTGDPFANLAEAQGNANGTYGVGVLNLTNLDGSLAQDMLAYGVGSNVPIPPTAYLLGAGLLGLVGLRRKFRK